MIKDEAYRLGYDWAKCYSPDSPTRRLIESVMDEYYLVNVVYKLRFHCVVLINSDFHKNFAIFDVFDSLNPDVALLSVSNGV
jgi:methylenetetrahydrofolate reductase (NADPH)